MESRTSKRTRRMSRTRAGLAISCPAGLNISYSRPGLNRPAWARPSLRVLARPDPCPSHTKILSPPTLRHWNVTPLPSKIFQFWGEGSSIGKISVLGRGTLHPPLNFNWVFQNKGLGKFLGRLRLQKLKFWRVVGLQKL